MAPKPKKRPLADFDRIKDEVSVEDVLAHYGLSATLKRSGSDLRGPCPIHGGDKKKRHFSVFHHGERWRCHGECDRGGNVLDLVMELEDCSIRDAGLKISEWFNLPLKDNGAIRRRKAAHSDALKDEATPRKKTKGAIPEDDEWWVEEDEEEASYNNAPLERDPLEGKLDHDHHTVRAVGLSAEEATTLRVGYASRGIMRGCVAVPITNLRTQELVGYVGIDPKAPGDTTSYRWPKAFKPQLELYNAFLIENRPTTSLVAGFDDFCKLHNLGVVDAVALLSDSVSDEQLELLRSLCGDDDERRIVYFHKQEKLTESDLSIVARLSTIGWVRAQELNLSRIKSDLKRRK